MAVPATVLTTTVEAPTIDAPVTVEEVVSPLINSITSETQEIELELGDLNCGFNGQFTGDKAHKGMGDSLPGGPKGFNYRLCNSNIPFPTSCFGPFPSIFTGVWLRFSQPKVIFGKEKIAKDVWQN